MKERYLVELREREGTVVPMPEPHNSVCPGFFPDLGTMKPPGVERVGPLGSRRIGVTNLL